MSLADDQEAEVKAFVEQHCLREDYHNTCRTQHPAEHLFMIFWDFDQTGLVINPNSQLPLIVLERECDELPSVEMVSTTARAMYLMDLSETQRDRLGKFFLLRTDVISAIGELGIA